MHRSIRCSIRGWIPFTKKGETGGQNGTKEMTLEQRVSKQKINLITITIQEKLRSLKSAIVVDGETKPV